MKTGYKRTDIGVIPVDWIICEINKCTSYVDYRGKTPQKTTRGRFLVTAKNIKKGYIDYEISKEYVADEEYENIMRRGLPRKGDVLITTEAPLGNVSSVDREDIALAQRVIKYRTIGSVLDNSFFKHYLLSERFQKILDESSSGSTAKGIKGSILHKLPVLFPPTLPEQKAIAEVLSDTDNLIQALEKRIAKKRLIKQGAMQKLLTHKDDWEVKKLGDILKVRHGKSQKDVEDRNGQYPILGTGGLMGYANQFLYDRESVLIGRKGTIDKPRYMDIPFWTVDTLFYTEIFKYVSPKCLFYKFLQIDWYSYNEASGVPSLNAKIIENIEISLPPLEEQTHIATILSDMDSEIQALEKKLAKYQQLKQGLMQNLLTGKIRLI